MGMNKDRFCSNSEIKRDVRKKTPCEKRARMRQTGSTGKLKVLEGCIARRRYSKISKPGPG
jgi:hypothetical protein